MVKAIVFDLSSSLVASAPGIQAEIADAVHALRDEHLICLAMTNRPLTEAARLLSGAGVTVDQIVTRADVGVAKGSPRWVDWICQRLGLAANELIFVGAEKYAMITASQARVFFLKAGWGTTDVGYGIPIRKPSELSVFVREFFNKSSMWYWQINSEDSVGRGVHTRSLLQGRGVGYIPGLGDDLMDVLHRGRKLHLGPFGFLEFILYHALGSMYCEGLVQRADLWTVYPGHGGGVNETVADILEIGAKLFRGGFCRDLLLRHTVAADASLKRVRGESVGFEDQVMTVCLNDEYQRKLEGSTVMLFDDFTTDGYSFDWARNLLCQAGAAQVIGVFVGTYRTMQVFHSPHVEFDPYVPVHLSEDEFDKEWLSGQTDQSALDEFKHSYERLKAMGRGA